MCKVRMSLNKEKNGVELVFTEKPSEDIRSSMKDLGFRWNHVKGLWYAKQNEDTIAFAKSLNGTDVAVDTHKQVDPCVCSSATYQLNNEHKGVEIKFNEKPSEDIRNSLKSAGFRYSGIQKLWYAKQSDVTINFAKSLCEGVDMSVKEDAPAVDNVPVPVGSIYHMSYGYEETHNAFFKVVAATSKTVRIVEVAPSIIDTSANSSMSEYCTVDLTKTTLAKKPMFVKDNVNGDVKRLNSDNTIKVNGKTVNMRTENKIKIYESWYA